MLHSVQDMYSLENLRSLHANIDKSGTVCTEKRTRQKQHQDAKLMQPCKNNGVDHESLYTRCFSTTHPERQTKMRKYDLIITIFTHHRY